MPLRGLYSWFGLGVKMGLIFSLFAYCGWAWALDALARGFIQ